MNAEPIKSERDHQRALKEIEGLMAAKPNTPEGDRLGLRVEWFELRGPLAAALGSIARQVGIRSQPRP